MHARPALPQLPEPWHRSPSDVAYFSGTSESGPLVAGVAALVIEAYRNTHGGVEPHAGARAPDPSQHRSGPRLPEQRAGRGARRRPGRRSRGRDRRSAAPGSPPARPGTGPSQPAFLASPGQLDFVASPGTGVRRGDGQQPVRRHRAVGASVRSLAVPFAHQPGQVTLDPSSDPTFVDDFGDTQSYREVSFTVPRGVDLMAASEAHGGGGVPVGMTLFDPSGRLANYTQDAGPADYSHAEVSDPTPGKWTAVFYTPQSGGLSGQVIYDFTSRALHRWPPSPRSRCCSRPTAGARSRSAARVRDARRRRQRPGAQQWRGSEERGAARVRTLVPLRRRAGPLRKRHGRRRDTGWPLATRSSSTFPPAPRRSGSTSIWPTRPGPSCLACSSRPTVRPRRRASRLTTDPATR